jgi:hypothetical protein
MASVSGYFILYYGNSDRRMQINEVCENLDGRIRLIDNIGLTEDRITTSGFTDSSISELAKFGLQINLPTNYASGLIHTTLIATCSTSGEPTATAAGLEDGSSAKGQLGDK